MLFYLNEIEGVLLFEQLKYTIPQMALVKSQGTNAPSIPLNKCKFINYCVQKQVIHISWVVMPHCMVQRQEWFRGTHRLHLHGRSGDVDSTFLWNVHTFLTDHKIFGMMAIVIFTVISHKDYTVYYTPKDCKLTYSPNSDRCYLRTFLRSQMILINGTRCYSVSLRQYHLC